MSKYKIYIVGALLLAAGLTIGWFIKPNAVNADLHQHAEMGEGATNSGDIWTCSMHPQIRQNEPGICPICEMDLIPLDNSLANDNPTILKMTKEAAKLAQVETFVVGGSGINSELQNQQLSSINVDGTVELDQRSVKSQTAHLGGRIDEMNVTFEGQYVSQGQKIATIYSVDLLAASQELITAGQYNDRVAGLKEAAISKLKNWKISDNTIQKILETGEPISTIDLFADHSGYVMSKKLAIGDYVRQGQALYTVGSTSNLWLIFNVFESDMANVSVGSSVKFTTPSLPGEEFQARVSYINPMLNGGTRTAVVRAEIGNRGNKLKPGMLLNGSINTFQKKSAGGTKELTIPNSAVLWTGERSVVYVQLPDTEIPSYEFREVKVINRSEEYSVVTEGLEIGDEIVVHGAFAIDAAAQLNNNKSMMNRNVTIKKEMVSGSVPSYSSETPDLFKDQLDKTVIQYIALKDALVATDAAKASEQAQKFIASLGQIDMSLLQGEAHIFWMEQLKALEAHGSKIESSKDVEEQRSQFDFLSQAMINALRAFGTNKTTYYVQHCPMVKDNQGADWISKEQEIRNPYFGDKMMKCGSVKLELN